MNIPTEYKGAITREQFLFHEMRTIAKLALEGKSDNEIMDEVIRDNLFQYPTERTVKSIVKACLKRIHLLEDNNLVDTIAYGALDSARQVCLLAMMLQFRVVYEFMVTVIGEKYRLKDFSFSQRDLNVFFTRLQEQNDVVASWSDLTIKKIKQVLTKLLVDNEYLDNRKSEDLNNVLIDFGLKNALIENRKYDILSAFNYFEGE